MYSYEFGLQYQEELESTDSEKYLEVTLSNNLKPAEHISNCANSVNMVLGMIQRTIKYKDAKLCYFCIKVL